MKWGSDALGQAVGLTMLLAAAASCAPAPPSGPQGPTAFDGLWCQFVGGRRQTSFVLDLAPDGTVTRVRMAAPGEPPDQASRVLRGLKVTPGAGKPLGTYTGYVGNGTVTLDIRVVNATKPEFREYQGFAKSSRKPAPRPMSCVAFRRRH